MMDKINGESNDNDDKCPHISDNSISGEVLDESQMQKTLNFGRKRLFGRKTEPKGGSYSGAGSGSVGAKQYHNRWSNITGSASSSDITNSINNRQNIHNNNDNNKSNGYTTGHSGGGGQTSSSTKSNASNDMQTDDKFTGDGIQYTAKLIGHEFVAEARGEHMCQQSIKKLKILQRGLGGHKRKVFIFISWDGIKIRDALTSELIYHHSVPQISFISRDESDTRAFGYVFGSSSTGHQFIALKTQKEAMPIMSSIGQLFAATLKRKKSEIIDRSLSTSTEATGAMNEVKSRRESSATLRPSRAESPNVPSMQAPPPPVLPPVSTVVPVVQEVDFFAAFEPMDSVFESDFKVNKENLDQMPMTSVGGIDSDPFASSFGSLSLSSGDWANFDEDGLSASASSTQHIHSNTNAGKPFANAIPNSNSFGPKAQMSNSFNDSSSSMALNQLFNASGHHNQFNNSQNFGQNFVNSEAVAIPPRPVERDDSFAPNQSMGSTTSSSDRYACFAEIHSISSSIFDSLCDQIATESQFQSSSTADGGHYSTALNSTSKSLNSSLNGGFGAGGHHQQIMSSSLRTPSTTGNTFYYSFDNPLNSEQQKQNVFFSQTSSKQNTHKFDTNFTQNNNEFNAQNVWNNHSNVWSASSSMSGNSSQVSGASTPNAPSSVAAPTPPPILLSSSQQPSPMSTMSATGFGINRSNDMLNEVMPVFAELDPLAKDRPFVDRSQFFVEHKQKPTLRSLNSESANSLQSFGSNSPTNYSQTNDQSQMIVSSVPRRTLSSNANPFSAVTNDSNTRSSPNPYNPFSNTTCAVTVSHTPSPLPPTVPTPPIPTLTPTPPPRPPSRDCPPIPPRNDLIRGAPPTPPKPPTPEFVPPLPRRRTILPEHRYQSFEAMNRQNSQTNYNVIPFNTSADDSSAPPLPNPQRKVVANGPPLQAPQPMARKVSQNASWDPFNCAFVDSQLSSIATTFDENSYNNSLCNRMSDSLSTGTSTPKQSSDPVPNVRHKDLILSEIKTKYEWIAESVDNSSQSSTTPSESVGAFGHSSGSSSTAPTYGPGSGGCFEADFSQFSIEQIVSQNKSEMRLELNQRQNSLENSQKFGENIVNNCVETDVSEDHISPPERNIFIQKSDPFADDFFADQ